MVRLIVSLISDERGQQSTKRLLAIVGTIFLCVVMVLTLYSSRELKPSLELISAIETIVIVCIGATTVDKFSTKRNSAPTEEK